MKRTNLLASAVLGGVLLVGTAGLALAQDPVGATPTHAPGMSGGGMMGGDMSGGGMMGGDMSGGGMMGGDMSGGGMLGGDTPMGQHEACDPAAMQALHAQHHPER